MTFREKFHKEFPEKKDFNPASKWCPAAFEYEEDWLCCPTDRNPEGPDCDECWDREIPERKVFYLCDGRKEKCRHSKRCYKNCKSDSDSCSRTTDIEHAVNFTRMGKGSRVFEERKQVNECENNIPITIEIEAYPSVSASEKKDLFKLIEERIRCMK